MQRRPEGGKLCLSLVQHQCVCRATCKQNDGIIGHCIAALLQLCSALLRDGTEGMSLLPVLQ